MTYEQHRDFLERGGPELQDPWFKAAAMRMFGERQAIYRTNQLAQEYATSFDKQNGNIDEFVSTVIAEDLEQWGDDEYFMGAYGPLMQDYRGKQTAQHTADLSTMMVDDAKAGVYDTFYGTAERMLAENKSPEEIVAALRGRYESNNGLLNVSFKDQDEEWMRVAKAYAEKGNLDMVKAMLESDRTGPDGIAMGPIASQREFAADAANTLETATRVAGKQAQDASLAARQKFDEDADLGRLNEEELISFYNQNPNALEMSYVLGRINQNRSVVAQAQQKAATAADKVRLENQSVMDQLNLRNDNLQLVEGNRVPFIQDAQVRDDKGEPKTITADQQRKWLAEDIQQQVQVIKDREGLTDAQAFDVEAAQFTMAGILNPTWESVLAAGPVAANAWSLSGEPPPSLVSGAELYMQLHAKSPVLLERHLLDAETKRFYETYRTAVEYGKMEPSQAYSHAANIVRNPPIDNPLTKLPKDDLKGIVRSIGDGKSWFGGGTANNEAYVSEWINLRAKEYGLMGTVTGVQAGGGSQEGLSCHPYRHQRPVGGDERPLHASEF
ncbi:hypothetical protein [Devosia sp. DBB001]|nr:hypothetical protein [Devosia sp. DBB001]